MRLHPTLATAVLAGWILATPPIDYDAVSTWTKSATWDRGAHVPSPIRTDAPRRQWDNVQAFDTAAECEQARDNLQKAPAPPKGKAFPPSTDDVLALARAYARKSAECVDGSVFGR